MEKGSKSIGVVDYGRGNLRSVCKALEAVGASVSLVTEAAQLDRFDAIVVPGVGAFGDCAENLRASGLWEPLREWLQAERPYLGPAIRVGLRREGRVSGPYQTVRAPVASLEAPGGQQSFDAVDYRKLSRIQLPE